MSIVRWDTDSDVYVYESTRSVFVCCDCSLLPDGADSLPTRSAMVAHLREHLALGHIVPARAIERLEAEEAARRG